MNAIKFQEMMVLERAKEKEFILKNRGGILPTSMMSAGMQYDIGGPGREYMPWKIYPIHLPNPPKVIPGVNSEQKHVQAAREHSTMAAFFHPLM